VPEEKHELGEEHQQGHPLAEEKVQAFNQILTQEEIAFLALESVEGPLLLTSRQFVGLIEGNFIRLPYEIIKDVDYGGGLVVKKGHTRLVLNFHAPVPFREKNEKSMTWQLDEESATHKETIMDWAFARSYMCGQCGARDLDYRTEKGHTRARCMHCATDHDIDLRNQTITPMVSS